MKTTKLSNCILSLLFISLTILSMLGCTSFSDEKGFGVNYDRRTAGTVIDDKGLELRSITVLTKDKEIWKNCHINVTGYNENIVITGQAPTQELKDRAAELLYRFIRRDRVYNQLTIEEPTSIATRAVDTWITTQVKTKILANKKIGINRVKVVTENGVVFLIGILTKTEEELATDIASTVRDVKQVIKIITEHEPINP